MHYIFRGSRQDFDILGQAPDIAQPEKCPFDNSTHGQDAKAIFDLGRDLVCQTQQPFYGFDRRAPLTRIRRKSLEDQMLFCRALKYLRRGFGVMHIGRVHRDVQQIT